MSLILRSSILSRGRPAFNPITIPNRWGHYGDSQTGGRATETNAVNPYQAFLSMYVASGHTTPTSAIVDGVSGNSLAQHQARYEADTFLSTPWFHVQESGNQNLDGQRTASEWGDTFDTFMNLLHTDWPSALITYETAFSFGREGEAYRNWTSYNTELYTRVAGLGFTVHVVDTDTYIKAADNVFGASNVWFQTGDAKAYHYKGLGNFIVALAIFDTLGYNVAALDHSGVDLDSGNKATAVALF